MQLLLAGYYCKVDVKTMMAINLKSELTFHDAMAIQACMEHLMYHMLRSSNNNKDFSKCDFTPPILTYNTVNDHEMTQFALHTMKYGDFIEKKITK